MTNKKLEQKTTEKGKIFNSLEMFKSLFYELQSQPNQNSQVQYSKDNLLYYNFSFYRTFV